MAINFHFCQATKSCLGKWVFDISISFIFPTITFIWAAKYSINYFTIITFVPFTNPYTKAHFISIRIIKSIGLVVYLKFYPNYWYKLRRNASMYLTNFIRLHIHGSILSTFYNKFYNNLLGIVLCLRHNTPPRSYYCTLNGPCVTALFSHLWAS